MTSCLTYLWHAFWVILSCLPQTVSQSGSALPYVALAWYWLTRRKVTYGCHCHHGNWTLPFGVLSPISKRIWKWAQNHKGNFLRDCEKNQQGPQRTERKSRKKGRELGSKETDGFNNRGQHAAMWRWGCFTGGRRKSRVLRRAHLIGSDQDLTERRKKKTEQVPPCYA